MKRLAISMILAVVLSLTFAVPAFAAPPPDAGKGAVDNDGLWNAIEQLFELAYRIGNWDPVVNVYILWGFGPPSYNKPWDGGF